MDPKQVWPLMAMMMMGLVAGVAPQAINNMTNDPAPAVAPAPAPSPDQPRPVIQCPHCRNFILPTPTPEPPKPNGSVGTMGAKGPSK